MQGAARRIWPALLLVAGLLMPALLGMGWEGYSPRRDFLSELGAQGSPVQAPARWLAFLPVGVAALGCAFAVWRRTKVRGPAALVALGLAVGYLGAAGVPCDADCPVEGGSPQQTLHNLFGLAQYALCAAGLLWAALAGPARVRSALALLAVAAGFALMVASPLSGLWQRLADFSAMLWLAWAVWDVPARRAEPTSG